jgi:hypothetical protein
MYFTSWQLPALDLHPGACLGFEVRNRAKFKSAFPVSAVWQPSFPPPIDEYVAARSLFTFDPAVLECLPCSPQNVSAPFVVAARIILAEELTLARSRASSSDGRKGQRLPSRQPGDLAGPSHAFDRLYGELDRALVNPGTERTSASYCQAIAFRCGVGRRLPVRFHRRDERTWRHGCRRLGRCRSA